ncbi:MAG TPA: VOC family protein [Acidimicrobiales bacterium]|nr:VOC family protein [Acidimicrobiales bacterium]
MAAGHGQGQLSMGPVAQLGYVVADTAGAMDHWTRYLGVGPFFFLPAPPLNDLRYRGEPSRARISVALAYSGDLQVELIEPLDEEPSPYRDFLDGAGPGLHHVAHFTEDFDAALAAQRAAGLVPYWEGRGMTADQRFAYYDSPHGGTVHEIVETAGLGAFFDYMKAESSRWDGADPVRTIEF